MTKDKIIEFHLKNEQMRYETEKEKQKTLRSFLVTLVLCATVLGCFWIYFGLSVEEQILDVSNGSQYIADTLIEGDNSNGR
jgi:hypothetical protein